MIMSVRLRSWPSIAVRSAFLAAALILVLVLHHLPDLLQLNQLRPRVTELLETTFHCRVLVGPVTG